MYIFKNGDIVTHKKESGYLQVMHHDEKNKQLSVKTKDGTIKTIDDLVNKVSWWIKLWTIISSYFKSSKKSSL